MVDFRRCITALAALAVFAGLAGAQGIGSSTPFSCATNVSSTPQIRGEGYTEQIGDITLTCTGGSVPVQGSAIPLVNITLFLNTQVTSRLIGTSASGNISEALLLIDEPGASQTGQVPATGFNTAFGPGAPQNVCPTPTAGCTEYVSSVIATTTNIVNFNFVGLPIAVPTNAPPATSTTGACGPAPVAGQFFVCATANAQGAGVYNAFQGIVSGNSVTWFGVPVLPPGTTGITRTFRLTNVRANATTLGGGGAAAGTPVTASIAVSNPSTLPITQAIPTVGFVQSGFASGGPTVSGTPSSGTGTGLNQCSTQTRTFVSTLNFPEGFGTAFKTRIAPNGTQGSGQGNTTVTNQNIPGTVYNSESGLIAPVTNGTAGLADWGTRLKATFANVPANVRLFVSVNNVINGITPAPVPGGGGVGSNNTTTYAQLVTGENAADTAGLVVGSTFNGLPAVTATDNAPHTGSVQDTVLVAEVVLTAGSGSAVWEVTNTNPSALETLRFSVYATYTSNVATNSPPPGTGTVSLSFAPTPGPAPAFSATSAGVASGSLGIPRFSVGTGTINILGINVCRTILLYPFVTNQAGFDTGLAIANTSTDPFGTGPQAGSCQMTWYSGANSPTTPPSPNIPSGTVYATLASVIVPNFQGYMIAVCQFQFAHGFAFISDLGAQKLAMGYLALVIPDPGVGNSRPANPISQAGAGTGENTSH